MAMGLPVVATRAGGMDEVITDQESGILIKPYSASQIADALKFLIDSPEVRAEIAKRAREVIENDYTIARQIRNFGNQYLLVQDVEKDH
jgi:glycosyltransferase involved in cell wall biosynthesis